MTLNRIFAIYEYYKMVKDVAGHAAEIGVYKGAGTLLLAKLIKIFENRVINAGSWF